MRVLWRASIGAVLLAVVALSPSEAASPSVDPGALAHCASMTVADERLACYDSLSRPKSNPAPAAPAASAPGKGTPSAAKAPVATSTYAPAAAATAGAAATGAAAATAAPDAKSFGLMRHPAPAAEEGPDRIQAKVTRVDTNRLGNVHVSLDNGQAWVFTAPEAVLRVGEAVTIKRGAIGSFLMTTANHHTYRVERTQ